MAKKKKSYAHPTSKKVEVGDLLLVEGSPVYISDEDLAYMYADNADDIIVKG